MSNLLQTQDKDRNRETIERKKTIATVIGLLVVSVLISLSLVQSVVAAPPKLPGSQTPDAIQGWCESQGGDYFGPSASNKFQYYCVLPDGTLIACQNNSCTVLNASNPHIQNRLQDVAILGVQTSLNSLSNSLSTQIQSVIDGLTALNSGVNALVPGVAVCSAPDLLPLPAPGVAGPTGFCRIDKNNGKLQVLVYNQGSAETDASGTQTTVVFNTSSGPSAASASTSPLAAGGSQVLEFDIPISCFGANQSTPLNCDFSIGVDAANTLAESNEGNNNAAGTCVETLQ